MKLILAIMLVTTTTLSFASEVNTDCEWSNQDNRSEGKTIKTQSNSSNKPKGSAVKSE